MARSAQIAIVLLAAFGVAGPSVGYAEANSPPGKPLLIVPSDGRTLEQGEPQVFTVSALDPDHDPYTATVTIRNETTFEERTLKSTPAPSAGRAHATPVPPLMEGSYTWSAHATDIHDASGVESETRSFTVGAPAVAGAGSLVKGTLTYDEPGIEPGSCQPTSFTVSVANTPAPLSHAALIDGAGVIYAGPLTVSGSGSSSCEDATVGLGTLTLSSVEGAAPNGAAFSCTALDGPFTRLGTSFTAELTGECEINGFPTGTTTWRLATEVAPLDPGGGITGPIREATFDGGFTVRTLLQPDSIAETFSQLQENPDQRRSQ